MGKEPIGNAAVGSGLCDFSRRNISLCLGALPKRFGKGHTAVVDAGMELSSVSAGESYSFALTYRNKRKLKQASGNEERMKQI